MPFKKLLTRLLEDIPGAVGAIIIDWEGEAVDQVTRVDEYDIKILGAHSGIILGMIREVLTRIDSGELDEVVIRTEQNKIMMNPLTEDYLLILQLDESAITARAAYKMKLCVEELRKDFDF